MQAFGERGTWYHDVHVDPLAKTVEDISQGRVKIEVFGRNELYPHGEGYSAVKEGYVNFTMDFPGYHLGTIPTEAVFQGLAGAFYNAADVIKFHDMYGFSDWFQEKCFDPIGLKSVAPVIHDTWQLWTDIPVNTPEDLDGLKIRTPGMTTRVLEQFGSKIVEMAGGEVYTAGMQGLLDGATRGGASEMESVKLQEPYPYVLIDPSLQDFFASRVLMSLEDWNALPDDIKLLLEYGLYAGGLRFSNEQTWSDLLTLDRLISGGELTPTTWSPEDKARMAEAKMKVWDEVAAEDPLAAEAVEMLKAFTKLTQAGA
jgi:TRAP-type mannitol/chloroaromatic compound transport system substrate-binding protein